MINEAFATGDSALHRMDPRLKLVAAAALAVVTASANQFAALTAAMGMSIALAVLTRLGPGPILKRLLVVNGFVLFLWLVLPLTVAGTPAVRLGPVAWTREGMALAARITVKSNAIVLALMALAATSPVASLGQALHRLHVPGKLVHLLLLTYRYIFVLEQEYQRLARAIRVRCFVPRTGLHTYRTYAYLMGMLLVRAAAQAERVHQAMVCRGFHGQFYSLTHFAFSRSDRWWSLGFAAAIIALVAIEWLSLPL